MNKKGKFLSLLLVSVLFFGCEQQENNDGMSFHIGDDGVQITGEDGKNIVNIGDEGVTVKTSSGDSILRVNDDGVKVGNGVITLSDDGVSIDDILTIKDSGIDIKNPERITKILNKEIRAKDIIMEDIQDLQHLQLAGYLKNIDLSTIANTDIDSHQGEKESNTTEVMQEEEKHAEDDMVCQKRYKDLVAMNYFDFSRCTNTEIRNENFTAKDDHVPTQSMVLIFDASGSMAKQINGKSRMEIAKKSVEKFLKTLDRKNHFLFSLVEYGHKGNNTKAGKNVSCAGIEEVVPMGEVQSNKIAEIISSFMPTGWTPISASLQKAEEILSAHTSDEKYIVVVSDGEETCGGDPVATVKSIKVKHPEIKVNVIGFDVDDSAGAQLKAIAEAGDGKYFAVSTEQQFAAALRENKKQLQKVDYALGRSIEQIYDMSVLTNTYMQCMTALERENAVMQIDIHGTKLLGSECQSYAEKRYSSRYEELKEIIQENYTTGKEEFQKNKSVIFEK